MGKQILSFGASSLLLFGSLQSVPSVASQDAPKQQTSVPAVQVPQPNDKESSLPPGQFILQDATPIFLRLIRNVSSANAHVGDSVDFEVLEDVAVNGVVVIPKGSAAVGTVTEVQSKRRMGRAGKLEIVLDSVHLADTAKAPIRAIKDAKGGSHIVGMTAGIVASGLLFFPVAPLFLLVHGNDITLPKGAALAAYVNGDVRLDASNFGSAISQTASPKPQLWLLQSEHVVGDVREGFRKTCVIVSPIGDYHREERKQVPASGRAELEWAPPRVFEAKLTQPHLDALRAILATPELHSIKGVVGESGSLGPKVIFDREGAIRPHDDIDIVTMTVARPNELQLFELADIPFARRQEPVSELLDWVKGTERIEQDHLSESQASNCSTQIAGGSSSVGGAPTATGMSFPKAIFAPEPLLPHGTPKPRPIDVEVLINPDGSVAKVSLESRASPEVAQSILDAVQRWKFQPTRLLGVPVADTVHLKIVQFKEK